MSFLKQPDLGPDFAPYQFFRSNFGFVPNLFSAQSLLPRVLEVEADLTDLLLVREGSLSPQQRQYIMLLVGSAKQNTYCFTLHWETLRALGASEDHVREVVANHRDAGLSQIDVALLDFSLKLAQHPLAVLTEDFETLREIGLTDQQILEAELVISYEIFACTLATGLGISADFPERNAPKHAPQRPAKVKRGHDKRTGPYLRSVELSGEFWPYPFFQRTLGFIPSYFRAQTLRPDLIESQARALEAVLLTDDVLTRVQKEFIFLVISAANLNTYCVANHCGVLRGLGIPEDESDRIAFNHHDAGLDPSDVALLDFALKLTQHPAEFSAQDVERLRDCGFSEERILEAVVLSGFANFINFMNVGLGVEPDFEPKHEFKYEHLTSRHNLSELGKISSTRMNLSSPSSGLIDEDTGLVDRVRAGDFDAFEELVRRHKNRVYRTLVGITGSTDEAEDYTQNVFLKAFKSLGNFAGTARFSTWLTRIAINEGIEQTRRRKKVESLNSGDAVEEEDFRPRQVQAWSDDPEKSYSRKELCDIVESELMRLPAKYRIVVVLRDIEELSNQEAADALDLRLEALKSRLLRGRLLLREALAPRFGSGKEDVASV